MNLLVQSQWLRAAFLCVLSSGCPLSEAHRSWSGSTADASLCGIRWLLPLWNPLIPLQPGPMGCLFQRRLRRCGYSGNHHVVCFAWGRAGHCVKDCSIKL